MSNLSESLRNVESEVGIPPSISSLMESLCSENFGNLIVAAEKLAKVQDSAKLGRLLANRMESSPEIIRNFLEKFSQLFIKNAMRRGVMRKVDAEKLWKGVESKFSVTMTLCDQLTETFQHLAGLLQDAEEDVDDCLVVKLWDSFEALRIVKDHSVDICNLVFPHITLKDRLKMSKVIVVDHKKFLRQLDLARTSKILTVFLFHLNIFKSYEKALVEYIELSKQYHYENGEDRIKFIVAKMEDSARVFEVTEYPTVVVMKGDKEVGRVSIFNTGFLPGVLAGLKVILNGCLEDDDDDEDS